MPREVYRFVQDSAPRTVYMNAARLRAVLRLLDLAPDPSAERAALEQRQPSGRLVAAEEVASAICFLASPDQRSTTGAVLAVDGGMDGLRVAR